MIAIVLGMGQQGRAAIYDLESRSIVRKVIAADLFQTEASRKEATEFLSRNKYEKTSLLQLDIALEQDLAGVYKKNRIDIVICMLPIALALKAAKACVDAGIPFVSSNYTYDLAQLHEQAVQNNCIILPEMGLDPGIDLVMGRLAVEELDTVHGLYSYGGGIPAPDCVGTSPIGYKISWVFDRVLDVYVRQAEVMKNGKKISIPGNKIFHRENVHQIRFEGIGSVEAYPNGDSLRYIELLNLGSELKEMARFALRWPGHSQFWRTMVELGLLESDPVEIDKTKISPRAFLSKVLTPKLQYEEDEQDLALLRVIAWGLKSGRKASVTYDLIDFRDMKSGLFAMNRTVGFTSSIAAQMILSGEITQPGVLSPVRDVPAQAFMKEIKARDMQIFHRTELHD